MYTNMGLFWKKNLPTRALLEWQQPCLLLFLLKTLSMFRWDWHISQLHVVFPNKRTIFLTGGRISRTTDQPQASAIRTKWWGSCQCAKELTTAEGSLLFFNKPQHSCLFWTILISITEMEKGPLCHIQSNNVTSFESKLMGSVGFKNRAEELTGDKHKSLL